MPTPVAVQRRTVLIIATLAAFLTPFMGSAVNIALPSIAADFALDAVSLSLVASSYLFATVIFLAFAPSAPRESSPRSPAAVCGIDRRHSLTQ